MLECRGSRIELGLDCGIRWNCWIRFWSEQAGATIKIVCLLKTLSALPITGVSVCIVVICEFIILFGSATTLLSCLHHKHS